MSDKPTVEKSAGVPCFDSTWSQVAVSNCQHIRDVSPNAPPVIVNNAIPPLQLHHADKSQTEPGFAAGAGIVVAGGLLSLLKPHDDSDISRASYNAALIVAAAPISILGLDHKAEQAQKSQCDVHHNRELSANVPQNLINNGLPMVEFLHSAEQSLNDLRQATKENKSWK